VTTPPTKHRKAYSSTRSRKREYEVVNLPPPWKRSLTESGMSRKPTVIDFVIVAVFFAALVAVLVWIAAHYL
jgi:hypothetical protein